MNPVTCYEPRKKSDHPCPDLASMAERELSAFFNAVSEVFGAEQAEISAEDWLQEVIEIDGLPASIREWRLITMKALSRLASRVNTSSLSTEPQVA
jgi:hypothetical protein